MSFFALPVVAACHLERSVSVACHATESQGDFSLLLEMTEGKVFEMTKSGCSK